jgi:exonuclease III
MSMLADFLQRHDIDVAFLQVTHNDFTHTRGYNSIVNEGTEKRGTAILVKKGLQIQNIKRISSGRGVAASFQGIWVMNIYAPLGEERKVEREHFLYVHGIVIFFARDLIRKIIPARTLISSI